MGFPRRLFAVMIAALLALYGVGASGAAMACVAPQAASDSCGDSDCDRSVSFHDCALSCAPSCFTVLPQPMVAATPDSPALALSAEPKPLAASSTVGPEPPPPRN